ncbi:uncharacterized protein LOC109194440 isoform X2 [Oreochromis niloticus]|uniref:uncharacterized protein LOC109194440 isoform X2 n=1 Tax=Oreochromis niloticus TaxID=8128 RepID=UPI000DF42B9E|nr:uncharacterized protein LOC109194440 isoform X2 [Oreochromis niloticus]
MQRTQTNAHSSKKNDSNTTENKREAQNRKPLFVKTSHIVRLAENGVHAAVAPVQLSRLQPWERVTVFHTLSSSFLILNFMTDRPLAEVQTGGQAGEFSDLLREAERKSSGSEQVSECNAPGKVNRKNFTCSSTFVERSSWFVETAARDGETQGQGEDDLQDPAAHHPHLMCLWIICSQCDTDLLSGRGEPQHHTGVDVHHQT